MLNEKILADKSNTRNTYHENRQTYVFSLIINFNKLRKGANDVCRMKIWLKFILFIFRTCTFILPSIHFICQILCEYHFYPRNQRYYVLRYFTHVFRNTSSSFYIYIYISLYNNTYRHWPLKRFYTW